MATDELILQTLHNSTLAEELRGAEVEALARIITVREYKAGEIIVKQGDNADDNELRDTLLILASGEVEATATTGGEKATLHLLKQGDLAGIIGFVGGNVAQVSANVVTKTDSKLLLLDRNRFEALLNSQPAIVYYVMRGIVRHVHGIVRRMNMQSVEMSNYLYRIQGRY